MIQYGVEEDTPALMSAENGGVVLYSEAQAEIDSKQAAFEASTDSFARVLDALKSASPASIVHHLNGEGACLQIINDLRYQIDALKAQNAELLAALEDASEDFWGLGFSKEGRKVDRAIARRRVHDALDDIYHQQR